LYNNGYGQGVGKKLLSAVLDLADNEAAISLYKKHGFTIEGEAQDYAFRNGKFVNAYYMSRLNKPS